MIFNLYGTVSMNSYSDALEKVDIVWTYLDKLLKNIIFQEVNFVDMKVSGTSVTILQLEMKLINPFIFTFWLLP